MGLLVAIINLWLAVISRIIIWINPMHKYKVTGPRVECTEIIQKEGVTIEKLTIMKFYKSNYLNYSQVRIREIYDDWAIYIENKREKEDSLNKTMGNSYSSFDDKKKEITNISVLTLYDSSKLLNECYSAHVNKEEIEEYVVRFTARSMISEKENFGAKCVYKKLSKETLEIE